MHSLNTTLASLKLGEIQSVQNLAMVPLLAAADTDPGYLTLDEALAKGYARVTEVSDAGSVPELLFINTGDMPVLLLDGEELVGAKQNRTLNLTILVPAQANLKIPVSCVEAGRWHHMSREFASEGRMFYAAGRAKRVDQVTASLCDTGVRMSRQGEVWADIAEKAARMGARSATGAMASMFDGYRPQLDAFRAAFHPEPLQCGALFTINGHVVGIDLFDAPATLRRVLPKLVGSYALDAIDSEASLAGNPTDNPEKFLADISAAQIGEFPAVGMGTDLRIKGAEVVGGGLAADERVVHLCAFRLAHHASSTDPSFGRLAGLRHRRQHWE